MKYYITDENAYKLPQNDFVPDLRWNEAIPMLYFCEEYDGTETVKLACTQHSFVSAYRQKQITKAWAEFLRREQYPMKTVQFCTRTPQSIFDAICTQKSITSLRFKWLATPTIEAIAQMKQLKALQISSGSSMIDLSPLSELTELETLVLGSTKKVTDYSPLGKLKNLKELVICSYPTHAPADIMTMESDAFLEEMPQLDYIDFGDVRIQHQTVLTPTNAEKYTFACFRLKS